MLRITDTHELSGWRPQPMDMPLEIVSRCPCCDSHRLPVVACVHCQQAVLVGECEECGWLGYLTRPRAEWFDSFYASDWDAAGQQASVDLSQCAVHPITQFVPRIITRVSSICDVGCGFGIAAYQLQQMGHDVYGIEKCEHRRKVAWQWGVRTARSLAEFGGKFDVVTAHHVLEHTVDPNSFIAEIAEHQDEGGILYLSVPNQVGEPSMGCLLFLPHLHSFMPHSLCALTKRHGYGLTASTSSGFNLELAFRKGDTRFVCPAKEDYSTSGKLNRAVHANGQGALLSWCGNLSDAWFTTPERFGEWRKSKWKPRAVRAERTRGPGRFPVELEVPCLFVK